MAVQTVPGPGIGIALAMTTTFRVIGFSQVPSPVPPVTPIPMRAANIIPVNTIVVAYVPFLPPPQPAHPGMVNPVRRRTPAAKALVVHTIVGALVLLQLRLTRLVMAHPARRQTPVGRVILELFNAIVLVPLLLRPILLATGIFVLPPPILAGR